MSVTRKELIARRLAFHRIVSELGLAPPPTSPGASSYSVKSLNASKIPAIQAVKLADSGTNNWIISPSTILPPVNEPTPASIITDFLETAQTAVQLAKKIEDFAKFASPDDSRKLAVIVGKCTKDFPKAKSCEQLFATTFTPEATQAIYSRGSAQASRDRRIKATKAARLAVLAGVRQSDDLTQNVSSEKSTKGNRANCSVNTIFVHAATHHEGMGGPDASLFLNYIPNYLISRAFPVLSLTINLPDGLDQRKLIQALGPSLILGDSIGLKSAPEIDGIFTKTIDPTTGKARQPGRSIGNDTFNTPQTLGFSRNKITTFLNEPDPSPVNQFSPIATIQDFSIDFDGGDLSSLMTREAVKGSLVLLFPDKTKITGLDQLLIGTNDLLTMTIDLGWSISPNQTFVDGEDKKHYLGAGDPMLQYVNSQKIRLNCTTTLSSMEFTDSGAVKVTLGLTDPANYDKVEPPHVADVPDYMKVYNKSDPRFVKFVTTVLNKAGSKSSGAGTDDIATKTGYAKAITHLFKASKKKSLSKNQQKQIDQYAKTQNSTHYKIDDLEAIKGGAKLKDGDLIVQHIDTIENTNQAETKGYDYYVINVKKGGRVKDLVKELIKDVEALKDKKGVKYPKSIDKDLAFLEACLAEEFLFFGFAPAGRDIPKSQMFIPFINRAEAVAKAHQKSTKKLKDVTTKGPLSASGKIQNSNFKDLAGSHLDIAIKGKKLSSTEWLELPPPGSRSGKLFYGGNIKLDYPTTLTPPMTKSQQKIRKKKQSAIEKSIATLSDGELKAARSEILFSTYSFILSNGYVVQTTAKPKSSMRIVNNVIEGKDKSKEALALESKDEVGGKIITWWYSSEHASGFVPFSHIVHHGLVQPLYASGRYDEIQVIYFNFNSACGRMSGMNIGDCPITTECEKMYNKQSNAFGIVNYIINTQINDVMKNKTPYGFKIRKEKSKNGKKSIKVMEPNQTVPKVEYLTRVLTAKDPDDPTKSRKILRISFIDHFCSDDENAGQRIMNSMRDDGRTTAVSPVKTVNMAATEAIRKKMFIKALTESGAIKESDTIDGEKVIQTGPKIFRIIKSAIKASHPHLNYGAMGSSLLRASISSEQGGREKMIVFNKAMKHKNSTAGGGRFKDGQAGKPSEIGITEVVGASRSVDIEMIGCPTLQVGSLYFIDFYTETDVDNFYICKKVSHKISNNMFRTNASFHLWDSGGRHTIPDDVDGFEKMKSEVRPE